MPNKNKSRWFKTVILFHLLQLTNPYHHSVVPCTVCLKAYRPVSRKASIRKIDHINKHSVGWKTWTLHQSSKIARYSVVKSDTYIVYIDQLELYQFTKIINMVMVGTPQQCFFRKSNAEVHDRLEPYNNVQICDIPLL